MTRLRSEVRRDPLARNGPAMRLAPDRTGWYLQGIRRAEQDGLIDYARKRSDDQTVVADDYGHIRHGDAAPLSLKYTNTRPLSAIARYVLNLYRNHRDVRCLELGPGAGVACATMSRLLPDAKLDTVSLTPLNPYLRFRRDDVYRHVTEPLSPEEGLSGVYEPCTRPFVHRQYIGKFPGEVGLPAGSYHVIYEDYGPLFHGFLPGRNDSPALALAALASALSLLQPDGTMVIMASDGWYRMEEALESIATDTDTVILCNRSAGCQIFPCIVAREGSPLAMRLRAGGAGLLPTSGKVLRLEWPSMEDVIARAYGLPQ